MAPEIAKLQLAKPIRGTIPISYPSPPFCFFSCRKLFTIPATLIVNNNNNRAPQEQLGSCAKFSGPVFRTMQKNRKHAGENHGREKEKLENTLLWWPSKSFALHVVAMAAIQMARFILHSPGDCGDFWIAPVFVKVNISFTSGLNKISTKWKYIALQRVKGKEHRYCYFQ